MNWCHILAGFFVSVVVGDIVINPLLERWLWPQLEKHHESFKRQSHTFTRQVGWLERALYTGAILVGAWEWVGVWLAIKIAARWRSNAGDSEKGVPVDNIWLIGTGLSVLFGFIGAWIASGHLPYFHPPSR
jgi:hypothetical protein